MEIENIKNISDWQGRCYRCVKEGFICQEPSVSEIKGGWKIYLDKNGEAALLVLNHEQISIDKCPLRSSLINLASLANQITEKAA